MLDMFWMFDNAPLGCMLLYKMSDQKKALFLPGARRILTLFLYLLSAIHIFASNLTFVPHVKISSKRPRSKRQVFTPRFLEAVGGSFEYSLQIIRFLPPNYQPSSTLSTLINLINPHQPPIHPSRPSVPIAKPTSQL
ncbi:MAG: hypothetical protein JNM22_17415 [Saprospiraceae bacterium]|nr:hypothetical protein [Saprospiraceae bacterium]